jgi:hypothetical protein
VVTVKVAVPPTETGALEPEQLGVSATEFAGPEVSEQLSVTVPEYPVVEPTVTVEVVFPPGLAMAAGVDADNVNTDRITVTEFVPVAAA